MCLFIFFREVRGRVIAIAKKGYTLNENAMSHSTFLFVGFVWHVYIFAVFLFLHFLNTADVIVYQRVSFGSGYREVERNMCVCVQLILLSLF